MAAALSVLSLDDFSIPETAPEEDQAVVYREEEVAEQISQAKSQAYEQGLSEGYEKGHQAAMEELAADQARALQALSGGLEELGATQEKLALNVEGELRGALFSLMGKLFPRIREELYIKRLEDLVQQAARAAMDSKKLVILLPQGSDEAVRSSLEEIVRRTSHDLNTEILEEPTLGPAAATARWDWGEINLDLDAFSEEVLKAISPAN